MRRAYPTRQSRRSARGVRSDSPKSDRPQNLTLLFPAAVVSELKLSGYIIRRVYEHGRLVGVRLLEPEPPQVTSSAPASPIFRS
jgi:hypothetical protein